MASHEVDLRKLAEEIKRRRIKFADLRPGEFEMLSGDEHEAIILALYKFDADSR